MRAHHGSSHIFPVGTPFITQRPRMHPFHFVTLLTHPSSILETQDADRLWGPLFNERWGQPTTLAMRAKCVAGSWRALFISKDATEKEAAPWIKPCPEELTASLENLANSCANKERGLGIVFLLDGSGSVHEGASKFILQISITMIGCACSVKAKETVIPNCSPNGVQSSPRAEQSTAAVSGRLCTCFGNFLSLVLTIRFGTATCSAMPMPTGTFKHSLELGTWFAQN